jgi:DNA-binding MarR family transcriptional regulator
VGEGELANLAGNLDSVSIRLLRQLRREEDASRLSAPRLSALTVLVFSGRMSLAELAAAEQVRPPTMSRLVDALVAAGLVTRDPVPDDRRSVRIEATAEGRRLLEASRARRVQSLVTRLSRLADSERRALARGIELIERMTA